jgi:dTDP-4-amino-4,6-dideoxygalactose transaminase
MDSYLPFSRPTIDPQTIGEIADTLASGWVTSGPQVVAFESALSSYCENRIVRTVTSATAALEIALQIAGIEPGDEVIVPAQTFFAVPNMIMKAGAVPVFIDVDLITRNIDLSQAEAAVTARTKAIMPTHFGGLPVDMDGLYELSRDHGLRVIEDAALALGSSWRGKRIGGIGDLVTFSFHPNKNITTIEGGAIVVNGADEAKLVERLRFHGISRLPDGTRDVGIIGGKSNLSDVSARLGVCQMRQLDYFIARRTQLATHYFECLKTDPPCVLPARCNPGQPDGHSWNMFCVLLPLESSRITRKQFIDATMGATS